MFSETGKTSFLLRAKLEKASFGLYPRPTIIDVEEPDQLSLIYDKAPKAKGQLAIVDTVRLS